MDEKQREPEGPATPTEGQPLEPRPENEQPQGERPMGIAESLQNACFELRGVIEPIKAKLADLIASHPECAVDEELSLLMSRRHEIVDNAIIAYRALEDARMRLGKVIQAVDGGKWVYRR